MELWSGWSRGDAWGGPVPSYFWTYWGPKGQKKKFGDRFPPPSPPPPFISVSGWLGPSPYLKVWIRLWSDWLKICFTQWEALISVFFFSGYSLYSNNSRLACFTEIRMWHTRNPSAVIRLGPSRINIWRCLDAHSILQGNKHHTKWVEMHSRDSYKDIM